MAGDDLDDVDRGILHLLQQDARNNSPADIADRVGVSPNTVRNRIERLEDRGVLQGYVPVIDYEAAGFQLRVIFICSVPVAEREAKAEQALGIDGTIRVIEVLSGHDNLAVEAIGQDSQDLTRITAELESVVTQIHDELFIRNNRVRPFDRFGLQEVAQDTE